MAETPRDRIIALARQGTPPREIAPTLGLPIYRVYKTIADARRRGIELPRFGGGRPKGEGEEIRFLLPRDVASRLGLEATRRGISRRLLILSILFAVADDDLFNAVLEDADA